LAARNKHLTFIGCSLYWNTYRHSQSSLIEDVSQSSLIALRWEMTEKSPLVLKNIVNHLLYINKFCTSGFDSHGCNDRASEGKGIK
jgi:hypothetical protein